MTYRKKKVKSYSSKSAHLGTFIILLLTFRVNKMKIKILYRGNSKKIGIIYPKITMIVMFFMIFLTQE